MNRRTLGKILIIAGVLVWVPYFYLKLTGVEMAEIAVMVFLIVHLSLVTPGALLAPSDTLYHRLFGRFYRR